MRTRHGVIALCAALAATGAMSAVPGTAATSPAAGAEAEYQAGLASDLGRGVPQDYREAVRHYRRAAEQGHAGAQFALAEMYKNGDGVAKSLAEAARWYRRSADQGNRDAQLLLGVLYEGGEGVPRDVGEAAKWYRLSAEQGDARAQLLLGVLYQLGQGVQRSFVAAYALYTASAGADASRGNPAPGHRAQLANSMSAGEIEIAKALSVEMAKPGNFGKALDRFLATARKP